MAATGGIDRNGSTGGGFPPSAAKSWVVLDIGGQVTRAGTLSVVSIEWMFATASRSVIATACAEVARASSSAATSLVGDPQNPTNTSARGARRRMRLTR